jgi:hypothetical protein
MPGIALPRDFAAKSETGREGKAVEFGNPQSIGATAHEAARNAFALTQEAARALGEMQLRAVVLQTDVGDPERDLALVEHVTEMARHARYALSAAIEELEAVID